MDGAPGRVFVIGLAIVAMLIVAFVLIYVLDVIHDIRSRSWQKRLMAGLVGVRPPLPNRMCSK